MINFIYENDIFKEMTREEALKEYGIIYMIENQYDKKKYIGLTINNFNKRYCGGRWWVDNKNRPANSLLHKVASKYGHDQFKIFILEKGIKNRDILNQKEKEWATKLNTYAPNGYNVRECGTGGEFYGPNAYYIKKISKKTILKTYKVKNIKTDEIITINNLPLWCSQNNIKSNCFRNLLCGIVLTSQGYCLPETKKDEIQNKGIKRKIYYAKNIKTGEILAIDNLPLFCNENNLTESCFRVMLLGITKTSQGFCLPQTIDLTKKTNAATIYLKHGANVIKIVNVTKFCKTNKLDSSSIYRLLRGEIKEYKNFTLP